MELRIAGEWSGTEREKRGNKGERENKEERVAGWDWQNKGKNSWVFSTDFIEVRDQEGLGLLSENRRREGELDGNTIYWEYKKG